MEHKTSSSDRREVIIAAAQKAFGAHGYAGTTVDAVAVEAGMSKGNLYNYFESKEALFKAVFAAAVQEAEENLLAVLTGPLPARRKLEAILDYWHGRLEQHMRTGRLVLEFWATAAGEQQGELAAALREIYSAWRGRIAAVLAQGVKEGEFGSQFDSPVAAALIMGILDGIEMQSILGVGLPVDDEFVASLKRAILAGLSAGTAGPGAR